MSVRPKTAFELTMERLKAADDEAGVVDTPLTDEQKERIGEARVIAGSRLAEREILFKDQRRKAQDHATVQKIEEEYRIDRERIESDRDRAIERIRQGKG